MGRDDPARLATLERLDDLDRDRPRQGLVDLNPGRSVATVFDQEGRQVLLTGRHRGAGFPNGSCHRWRNA